MKLFVVVALLLSACAHSRPNSVTPTYERKSYDDWQDEYKKQEKLREEKEERERMLKQYQERHDVPSQPDEFQLIEEGVMALS